ncbi:respiratory supercomplex factor 1, mitochondrial [Elaphomyces granulatus]|jgi:hypothetical protein
MSDKSPTSSPDVTTEFTEETSAQKFRRRLREEPLIPLGCAATCYALYRAYRSMRARDSFEMNRMFRARIYAQFFTLVAVVAGGIYYKNERKQRKEFERMIEERKVQEKRDAWLRELEIREKEDKGWRERHAAIGDTSRNAEKMDVPPPASGFDTNKSVQEAADEQRRVGVLDAVKALVSRGK